MNDFFGGFYDDFYDEFYHVIDVVSPTGDYYIFTTSAGVYSWQTHEPSTPRENHRLRAIRNAG